MIPVKARLKLPLTVGFVLSFSLHLASAAITHLIPFRDYPMVPQPIFICLLLPGWIITGGPWPLLLWKEAIAATINGAVYCGVILGLLAIWDMRHR